MRDVINKGLTIDDILGGATTAFQGGWNKVKSCILCLACQQKRKEDIERHCCIINEIAKAYYETVPKEKRNGKVQIVTSTSFFIPKPFTPFQWAQMNTRDEFWKRHILSGMRSRASSTRRVSNTTGTKQIFRNWKASLPVATESFAVSFTVLTKKAVYLMPGANISKMISGWKHLRRKGSILLSIRPDTEVMTKSFHGILYPAA